MLKKVNHSANLSKFPAIKVHQIPLSGCIAHSALEIFLNNPTRHISNFSKDYIIYGHATTQHKDCNIQDMQLSTLVQFFTFKILFMSETDPLRGPTKKSYL